MRDYNENSLYEFILKEAGRSLLFFDEDLKNKTDNPVINNVGWLDFTHGLTFANAVRNTCEKYPHLWRAGLLQILCFIGRNKKFRKKQEWNNWKAYNDEDLRQELKEKLLDHGQALPIFSSHLTKTFVSIFQEAEFCQSRDNREVLLAALNKYFNSKVKPKHVLRNITQSVKLVQKDF